MQQKLADCESIIRQNAEMEKLAADAMVELNVSPPNMGYHNNANDPLIRQLIEPQLNKLLLLSEFLVSHRFIPRCHDYLVSSS